MARLKSRVLVITILCGLLFFFCTDATRSAVGKETAKEADPYAGEVVRHKNRVAVSKAFVNAVQKNNAVVLSRAAVRQHLGKDGRVDAVELVQIDRGSSVAKMGFRSGDRIKSVNGIPLCEVEARRYEIETSNRWELLLYRHGKPRRIVIEVRE